jgi:UDP-4-amino-4,6-dideoxy-N-acetyl-beta-L-altrosamine N-acetyltransferase
MNVNLEKFGVISLVNFIDLTNDERLKVLEMRNHPEIRKWMYSQELIPIESHLKFICSLKKNVKEQYFLVSKSEKWIGVLCFINIKASTSESEFGFYANPFEITPGAGRILEMASIHYAFEILHLEKLKLEVFCNNKKVVNLHNKYQFECVGNKKVGKKDVLCMELHKANRLI